MANKVDFEHMLQIERLKQTLGEAECLRLGFIVPDERGVM
jgi:hypothetical protein